MGNQLGVSLFGIPWSFKYWDLTVTNTCSLDTGLMTIFQLQYFRVMDIPEDQDFLRQTCASIERMEFDKARCNWVLRYLRPTLPVFGSLDMFSEISETIIQPHASLFKMSFSIEQSCSDAEACESKLWTQLLDAPLVSICDNAHDNPSFAKMISRYVQNVGSGQSHFGTINASNLVNVAACDQRIDPHNPLASACKGCVINNSVTVTVWPQILAIEFPVGTYGYNTLPRFLKLQDRHYKLGALIYYNQGHFTSLTIIEDSALFYDGMAKGHKCKWVRAGDVTPTGRATLQCAQSWYIIDLLPPVVDANVSRELSDKDIDHSFINVDQEWKEAYSNADANHPLKVKEQRAQRIIDLQQDLPAASSVDVNVSRELSNNDNDPSFIDVDQEWKEAYSNVDTNLPLKVKRQRAQRIIDLKHNWPAAYSDESLRTILERPSSDFVDKTRPIIAHVVVEDLWTL